VKPTATLVSVMASTSLPLSAPATPISDRPTTAPTRPPAIAVGRWVVWLASSRSIASHGIGLGAGGIVSQSPDANADGRLGG
jgi:hypothetical protein